MDNHEYALKSPPPLAKNQQNKIHAQVKGVDETDMKPVHGKVELHEEKIDPADILARRAAMVQHKPSTD